MACGEVPGLVPPVQRQPAAIEGREGWKRTFVHPRRGSCFSPLLSLSPPAQKGGKRTSVRAAINEFIRRNSRLFDDS